jgi:hypothetical protein
MLVVSQPCVAEGEIARSLLPEKALGDAPREPLEKFSRAKVLLSIARLKVFFVVQNLGKLGQCEGRQESGAQAQKTRLLGGLVVSSKKPSVMLSNATSSAAIDFVR